ncbi:MAG: Npt1/Npt2 family nucleotide transporter [Thermoanaerobaculia bacterium]
MSATRHRTDDSSRSWLVHANVDLRCGESRLCWLLFTIHFLLLTFHYASKSIRQSTYIDALGAEQLPFVYLLVAICSYPVLLLYGRLVDRYPLRQLISASAVLVAANLVVFWWLFGSGGRWVSVVFYVWVGIVGLLLVSQFWSYTSLLLDARQAKRLFGFIGAGGLLGGITGGQIARWTSEFSETRGVLLVAAAVMLVLTAVVSWRGQDGPRNQSTGRFRTPISARVAGARTDEDEAGIESLSQARDGLSVVRRSKYLRLIAALIFLSAMVAQVIDLQFAWVIQTHTASLGERTAAFGNLYSVMGVAAFAFQMLFTARIHRGLGVGFALRVLPVTNGLGSVLFGAAALLFPALVLPAVWLLKIAENGLRYSLDQASRELLFLPVPSHQRAQAKAFIDVFVQRAAKGVAAIVLLIVTVGWFSAESVAPNVVWIRTAAVSAGLIVVWLTLIGATRRRYVAAFRQSLLRREIESDGELEIEDAATLEVLVEGLGSADPREVLHSLELLSSHGRGRLVPPLMLHHPDVEVRCKTLEILQDEKRSDATPLIETLLADPQSGIRVAATRALATLDRRDIRRLMSVRLADPDPRIRAAAVSYLEGLNDPEARRKADRALAEMLADGDSEVRLQAARALGEIDEPRHCAGLVQLLYDSDPTVVKGAVDAVLRRAERGPVGPLYTATLVSHLHDRKLKHDARDALVALGEAIIPALQHFMNDVQEDIWVRRALPKTIARIGGRAALETLTDCLEARDPFLRRKVMEALLSLCSHDLSLRPRRHAIESQIAAETRSFLCALTDLASLGGGTVGFRIGFGENAGTGADPEIEAPHLLERLLADRMSDHHGNLFVLLALIHTPRDIRAAYKSLESGQPRLQAHALEYLDNLLVGEVRRLVFAVIDDLPVRDRMRHAKKLFELEPTDAATTLRRLATLPSNGDVDAAWLSAAALQYIHDRRLAHLYPAIRAAAAGEREPLVRETAASLMEQITG